MDRINCRCGHVISTNHDTLLEYRGDLLPEINLEKWSQAELQQLKMLIAAIEAGKSVADIVAPGSSDAVVDALLPWKISGESLTDFSRSVYQCGRCGRLLIETSQRNHFRSFLPESDDSHSILAD